MKVEKKDLQTGFTLLELMLVIVIFGMVLSVVLPRAIRATHEAKFSHVRQYASEIAGRLTEWSQNQVAAQREDCLYTIKDYFMENIDKGKAGFKSFSLVNKYTGNDDFNGVEMLTPPEKIQKNPFNGASYFSKVNDDPVDVPSPKPGLIYFVSAIDPAFGNRFYRNFYLIFTDSAGKSNNNGDWYGQMDDDDEDAIRRGVFVARLPDSKTEY